jgi:hypothetical protein
LEFPKKKCSEGQMNVKMGESQSRNPLATLGLKKPTFFIYNTSFWDQYLLSYWYRKAAKQYFSGEAFKDREQVSKNITLTIQKLQRIVIMPMGQMG